MNDFPWNKFWQLVHAPERPQEVTPSILKLLRQTHPIQSLSLLVLATDGSNRIARVLYANANGAISTESLDIPCSLSRWTELHDWAQSGSLLEQPSPKRSGKLAWLATEELTGVIVASPLRSSDQQPMESVLGVAIFEIDHGRSLSESSTKVLMDLAPPLWFYLQKFVSSAGSQPPAAPSSAALAEENNESIVGSSQGLRKVMERVALVSNSDMPVLILGDTGTGKEVIARAIHLRSARSRQPFLRVNCGAIPPELIDSQLFGHERGSFTGASDQRKGWFERADGGTLFLDEVGELPLAAQVRLLRVLQEHQIERVGGEKTIQVDVRIVAATHRDLASMVHQRTFREDLWYRINLFPILLPRLCERLEDIPALTRHFARKAAEKLGLPYAEPTRSDIDQLLRYPWPGNIRELQAVVDRAVILGRGQHLDFSTALGAGFNFTKRLTQPIDEPTFYEVIPESSYLDPAPAPEIQPNHRELSRSDSPILPLDAMIKQHIERALAKSEGQVEGRRGAARILQINPHTLRAKMRKLGIRWADFRRSDEDL